MLNNNNKMSVHMLNEFKYNVKEMFNKRKDWIYKETEKKMVFIKKYRELDRFEISYNNARNGMELCVPLNASGLNYYCVVRNNIEERVKNYLDNYESSILEYTGE